MKIPPWRRGQRVYAVNGRCAHLVDDAARNGNPQYALTFCRRVVDPWWQADDRFADTLPLCERCNKTGGGG